MYEEMELKPCPFCGGKAVSGVDFINSDSSSYVTLGARVRCVDCNTTKRVEFVGFKYCGGVISFDSYIKAFNEVIEKWNTRKEYKEDRVGCEFCKHNFRKENERPCSLCQHNFMDMFEEGDGNE